jgi:hypothetical protein
VNAASRPWAMMTPSGRARSGQLGALTVFMSQTGPVDFASGHGQTR